LISLSVQREQCVLGVDGYRDRSSVAIAVASQSDRERSIEEQPHRSSWGRFIFSDAEGYTTVEVVFWPSQGQFLPGL
jgi:hypothetical protein